MKKSHAPNSVLSQHFVTVLFLSGIMVLLATLGSRAADMPRPSGHPILRVTGPHAVQNAPEAALFDLELLDALAQTSFATTTIWTDGVVRFSGVSLADLLAFLGSKTNVIEAVALNDYSALIPASDAVPTGPIIATRMNGTPMSIRDKGPLWIVYPYDSDPAYQTETTYTRSVWQLSELRFLE